MFLLSFMKNSINSFLYSVFSTIILKKTSNLNWIFVPIILNPQHFFIHELSDIKSLTIAVKSWMFISPSSGRRKKCSLVPVFKLWLETEELLWILNISFDTGKLRFPKLAIVQELCHYGFQCNFHVNKCMSKIFVFNKY